MCQNNNVLQVIIDSFLQHPIEVSFIALRDHEPLQFIPDCVKEEILNQLSDSDKGDFTAEQTGGFAGKWRTIKLGHNILHRLAMWIFQVYPEDMKLTEADFIKWFGEFDGKNLFKRWTNYYKCDFMRMITHFGPSGEKGQIFCDMVMEQINKYETKNK